MAQFSYDQFTSNASSSNSDGVSFFSLKNGEEAIVRIMVDDIANLDIFTVHPVKVGDSAWANYKVNCIEGSDDPVGTCPFCARGDKPQSKMFIKMFQYVNENGNIVAKPVVWERGAYDRSIGAKVIKSYLDNYGPLSQMVCKIGRTGEKLETQYTVSPNLNPQMYSLDKYPIIEGAFDNFNVLGRLVMNKSRDEINHYIQFGSFPQTQNSVPHTTPMEEATEDAMNTFNGGYTAPSPTIPNNGYVPNNPQNNWTAPSGGYYTSDSTSDAPAIQRPQRY